jgi:cytoskeletal protein RodZ
VELIENGPLEQGVLPEPEPRYHTAILPVEKSEHGQSIVRILASILVGLILIVLIVLLARWIYHKAHHASENVPPSTTLKVPASSSKPTNNNAQPQPGTGTPPTASPNNASNPPTGSNTQITNTGPGDVAAIFVGTTLAAAGLHYILNVRKFSRGQV